MFLFEHDDGVTSVTNTAF